MKWTKVFFISKQILNEQIIKRWKFLGSLVNRDPWTRSNIENILVFSRIPAREYEELKTSAWSYGQYIQKHVSKINFGQQCFFHNVEDKGGTLETFILENGRFYHWEVSWNRSDFPKRLHKYMTKGGFILWDIGTLCRVTISQVKL